MVIGVVELIVLQIGIKALTGQVCVTELKSLADCIDLAGELADVQVVALQLQNLSAKLVDLFSQLLFVHKFDAIFALQIFVNITVDSSDEFVLDLGQIFF